MLVSAEEQGDFLSAAGLRHDARGEQTLALGFGLLRRGATVATASQPRPPVISADLPRNDGRPSVDGACTVLVSTRLLGQCLPVHHPPES